MSARLPYWTMRHVQIRTNRSPHIHRLFSSSSRTAQQHDPATSLLETIKPAKTARPIQDPVSSRGPSDLSAGADNPFLGKALTGPGSEPEKAGVRNPDRNGAQAIMRSRLAFNTPARKKDDKQKVIKKLEAQITRTWREGDIYTPHDLSPTEMLKNKMAKNTRIKVQNYAGNTRSMKMKDALDELNINPLMEYKNFAMMSEFMSDMGKIKHRRETGFRAPNQRKMAKAVRRAIGIGILPSVHKHPELFIERRRQMQKGVLL